MKLIQNGPEVYPGAKILEKKNGENISLRYVDRSSIRLENGDVVHRHMIDGDAVLFNRQPSLHRPSMMCHIVKVMKKGDTFRMNVADELALATGSVKSVLLPSLPGTICSR
jgi:DNA-directed RNA polymerase beta' subunit